ncbi:MAG TPA: erythromycin esterase family protein [Solirubrobacteraceae bacterium]|nr:erythromycin esterase family protein [Solirubrobacteraceae bacterium]
MPAAAVRRLTGSPVDHDALVESIGDARFVLIGDATHGSHELYAERARITRWLVARCGFRAVAVEADWPDAQRVNAYVSGRGPDRDAGSALGDFARFPRWMWRNTVVRDFVEWLRRHNDARAPDQRTGFYGLDLYSLTASIEAVVTYLDRTDPAAAGRARARYACFDHVGAQGQRYAEAVAEDSSRSCEEEAVAQVVEMLRGGVLRTGHDITDDVFDASQNARLVRDAERYSRALSHGRAASWNLRDEHMADTVEALAVHLGGRRAPARIVVWAHNSHVGDARATETAERGEHSVCALLRDRHPGEVIALGLTTAQGTVTAAADWGAPAQTMRLRAPLDGSVEQLLHETGTESMLVPLGRHLVDERLRETWLERAVGAVYRPEAELFCHYMRVRPAERYDAVIHIDRTHALEPLDADAVGR